MSDSQEWKSRNSSNHAALEFILLANGLRDGKGYGVAGVLFVHINFPGQFGFIAEALKNQGENVAALGSGSANGIAGIPMVRWSLKRGSTPGIWPDAVRAEADLIRGRAALDAASRLKAQGFEPDLIIGHPGWGETLFLTQLWPDAKLILYAEMYYHAQGLDVGFDPEFPKPDLTASCRTLAKNATMAWAYTEADCLVSPTPFQASTLPRSLRDRVCIIHEGADLAQMVPDWKSPVVHEDRVYEPGLPLLTFVNRVIEPLRGCHTFFRALPAILDKVPEAKIVIVGSEQGPGYGLPSPAGTTWKEHFWKEVEPHIDSTRVDFVGSLPPEKLHQLMAISSAHVYLTYPFVLSWSLMEAMANEALVIASDTAPVRDVIRNGDNGVLVDFFRPDLLAAAVITVIEKPDEFLSMRSRARETIVRDYDRQGTCLPKWLELIRQIRATS